MRELSKIEIDSVTGAGTTGDAVYNLFYAIGSAVRAVGKAIADVEIKPMDRNTM